MVDLKLGDCLEVMKEIKNNSIDLIVTSPPYYNAREYSHYNSYDEYINNMIEVFTECFQILKQGRMLCVNVSNVIEPRIDRSHESTRYPLAFHFVNFLEKIGFKFLEDIIWIKPDGSALNRNGGFFKHRQPIAYKPNIVNEYIFVFQKPCKYLIDKIVKEHRGQSLINGQYDKTNVWYINPISSKYHPAPFPIEIPYKLIRYYSYENDTVLDPFMGSGTTGVASINLNRNFIGIEKVPKYFEIARNRIEQSKIKHDRIEANSEDW